ncbi:MAG: DUF4296 domain-containing protein [Bacteroidetes bacterium]|nr:DUF4296 domain-containing protein [Bacteroidota bacterium]HET6245734.1 DUF4296 domain-containing protein [Bacteroidia bacterium]
MKKCQLFVPLLLLFVAFGCKNNTVRIPAHIISHDSIVNILADIHIMEALNIQGAINIHDSVKTLENYKLEIIEKYNLDVKRFDTSYAFYTANPQLLDKVYNDILIELSKKKAEAEN